MKMPEEHKPFVTGCVIAVLSVIAVYVLVLRNFDHRRTALLHKSEGVHGRVKRYHPTGGLPILEAIRQRGKDNGFIESQLDDLKQTLEIHLPDWHKIPENEDPSTYFWATYSTKRQDLRALCTTKDVDLLDRNVGFDELTGLRLTAEEAAINLKKLAIVEILVTLLSDADARKIVEVTPGEPAEEGAVRRRRNPRFGRKKGQREYIEHAYPEFIMEYPVKMRVVMNIDALMRFLNSVKQKDRFLVIREMDVYSLGAAEQSAVVNLKSLGELKHDDVLVTISAAGMSFFEPEKVEEEEEQLMPEERIPTVIRAIGA